MTLRTKILFGSFATFMALGSSGAMAQSAVTATTDIAAIVENYANIGLASYQDSLEAAELLRTAIEDFLNDPTDETLEEARSTWRTARIPYEQSEVFVYANPVVEDWVDRVNAWPINESFIDYVHGAPGDTIVNARALVIDGAIVEIPTISPEIIASSLHQVGSDVHNIASGYHVIEFLLWGEDNSSSEEKGIDEGAGVRPASDYDLENCTNEDCARRGEYLYSAVNLLIDDLEEMVAHWQVTGEARRTLTADPQTGLSRIFAGLGSLSYGELAGDRLQTSLLLQDADAELDRFSNNSHVSYLFNARGVVGVYFGEYFSMQGELTRGASLAELMKETAPELDEKFRTALGLTMARMRLMIDHARDVEAFDLMIADGNEIGNQLIVDAVSGLVAQSAILQEMVLALDLEPAGFLGSDALDNPGTISR